MCLQKAAGFRLLVRTSCLAKEKRWLWVTLRSSWRHFFSTVWSLSVFSPPCLRCCRMVRRFARRVASRWLKTRVLRLNSSRFFRRKPSSVMASSRSSVNCSTEVLAQVEGWKRGSSVTAEKSSSTFSRLTRGHSGAGSLSFFSQSDAQTKKWSDRVSFRPM